EAVVLCQHAAGAGGLTKLVRVDTSHRQPRREQGTDDPALVTTARLKANRGDCERAQPCHQHGPAGLVGTHPKETPPRPHHPPSGSTTTSKRSFDTSIPQKESMAIFVSHPC